MVTETCVVTIVQRENKEKRQCFGLFSTTDYFLEATAVGPNGYYTAGRVQLDPMWDFYQGSLNNNGHNKLNFLIQKLYEDGWQSTGGDGLFQGTRSY
jgi:hypothetical protein